MISLSFPFPSPLPHALILIESSKYYISEGNDWDVGLEEGENYSDIDSDIDE